MLYIHIPFCKQACHYCNFHFSTTLHQKSALVEAILHEIELRKDYLGKPILSSIYFGGGTPSLLTERELQLIFEKIYQHFTVKEGAEITLEANPDDLNLETLRALQATPINRLSIGVQSFFQSDLEWMNRAHTAQEADGAIKRAQDQGFEQLSIDLIYGAPSTSDTMWADNLEKMKALSVQHLSCYALTVEDKTALAHLVAKGKVQKPSDKRAAKQFQYLMDWASKEDWHHYEISNFAQAGFEAKHNSDYWNGVPYLGLGPSAHSFNGTSRQWNIANNALYIKALNEEKIPFELEKLSEADRYNEYIMTGLRLSRGVNLNTIKEKFGERFAFYFEAFSKEFLAEQSMIKQDDDVFVLSKAGKLRADAIASDLFFIEEE